MRHVAEGHCWLNNGASGFEVLSDVITQRRLIFDWFVINYGPTAVEVSTNACYCSTTTNHKLPRGEMENCMFITTASPVSHFYCFIFLFRSFLVQNVRLHPSIQPLGLLNSSLQFFPYQRLVFKSRLMLNTCTKCRIKFGYGQ